MAPRPGSTSTGTRAASTSTRSATTRSGDETTVRSAWPALAGLLFPVFFMPGAVDAYVLPRVALLLVAVVAGLALSVRHDVPQALRGLRLPALAMAVVAIAAALASIAPWASLAGQYLR